MPIAFLIGLQMLTCGADPLPQVRTLMIERDLESPGSVVEQVIRWWVFALVAGFTLGKLVS